MAYCRWSQCDAYVYESEEGWVTHIASRRNDAGKPPPYDLSSAEAIVASAKRRERWHEMYQDYTDIELPEAGESFVHHTPKECAENLKRLKAIGFDIPQYVIDELEEEESE